MNTHFRLYYLLPFLTILSSFSAFAGKGSPSDLYFPSHGGRSGIVDVTNSDRTTRNVLSTSDLTSTIAKFLEPQSFHGFSTSTKLVRSLIDDAALRRQIILNGQIEKIRRFKCSDPLVTATPISIQILGSWHTYISGGDFPPHLTWDAFVGTPDAPGLAARNDMMAVFFELTQTHEEMMNFMPTPELAEGCWLNGGTSVYYSNKDPQGLRASWALWMMNESLRLVLFRIQGATPEAVGSTPLTESNFGGAPNENGFSLQLKDGIVYPFTRIQ